MYGLVTRALGTLFMVLLAAVALLWQWASENPWLAAFAIPSVLVAAYALGRMELDRRQAITDARLRDEHVPSMSPREYEQFTARQLERAGWKVLHVGKTGDQGCDVLAELRGFKAVLQCKLYRKRAGNDAVQQAVAARRHYSAQIVAVVAPAGFTRSAVELAESNGVHLLHHTALAGLERAARIP
jgi:HJR/Mrr/RecB family endonuclease